MSLLKITLCVLGALPFAVALLSGIGQAKIAAATGRREVWNDDEAGTDTPLEIPHGELGCPYPASEALAGGSPPLRAPAHDPLAAALRRTSQADISTLSVSDFAILQRLRSAGLCALIALAPLLSACQQSPQQTAINTAAGSFLNVAAANNGTIANLLGQALALCKALQSPLTMTTLDGTTVTLVGKPSSAIQEQCATVAAATTPAPSSPPPSPVATVPVAGAKP